jgi:arylsulfatase A-like enzyme
MYEPSLRMPFIVKWPGVIKAGSDDSHLVQNLDLAQTFLEMAGVEQPKEMQGRSLVPLMRGQPPGDWRDAIYYHYYDYPAYHMVKPHLGVRTERYKLIHYYTLNEWELFDLEKDPREMRSVFDDPAYAQVRRELEGKLKSLQAQYRDTDPTAEAPSSKVHRERAAAAAAATRKAATRPR